jgi:hypothetical protein
LRAILNRTGKLDLIIAIGEKESFLKKRGIVRLGLQSRHQLLLIVPPVGLAQIAHCLPQA